MSECQKIVITGFAQNCELALWRAAEADRNRQPDAARRWRRMAERFSRLAFQAVRS
jgi:hypothetical protein